MTTELWDILDENRNKTGRTVERGKPMKQNEFHLVVHVWIKNDKGEYLIQKRTANKSFPLMWDITGGSAVTGDDSLSAALREVKEEIGIDLLPENGNLLFSLKRQNADFPDIVDVWLFKNNTDIKKLIFHPDEVCGAKWASPEKIYSMIKNGEFVNVLTYLDELFDI
jgi:8-oxo-dGTP pyrophosphatase MutT (NUDIX family)